MSKIQRETNKNINKRPSATSKAVTSSLRTPSWSQYLEPHTSLGSNISGMSVIQSSTSKAVASSLRTPSWSQYLEPHTSLGSNISGMSAIQSATSKAVASSLRTPSWSQYLEPHTSLGNNISGMSAIQSAASKVVASSLRTPSWSRYLEPNASLANNISGMSAIQSAASKVVASSLRTPSWSRYLEPNASLANNIFGIGGIQSTSLKSIVSSLNNINTLQQSFHVTNELAYEIRSNLLQKNRIAREALKIPNIYESANVVLEKFTMQVSISGALHTISSTVESYLSSTEKTSNEELKSENNEFFGYWVMMYEQIVKIQNVVNPTIILQALRDIISVLSLVVSLQGEEAPQINIHNDSNSDIEINAEDEKIDIIITNHKEQQLKTEIEEIDNEKSDIILNPGIRS